MKIAIFGDSISEGIGKRKINYCDILADKLKEKYGKVDITNFAHTGTTIQYMRKLLLNNNIDFDVVIIAYGNVDAMLRPDINHKPNYYKYLPNRYKQNGMLNPRPYFSSKWYKSSIQHLDSWFRWNLNRLLLRLQGSTTWVAIEEFQSLYIEYIEKLIPRDVLIILVSTVQVKSKYFPGTNDEYAKFNNTILDISQSYHNSCYIDLFNNLCDEKFFYKDGFHPNKDGYIKIAELIFEKIKEKEVGNCLKL